MRYPFYGMAFDSEILVSAIGIGVDHTVRLDFTEKWSLAGC